MRSLHIIPLFVLAFATSSCEALWDTSTDLSPSGTVSVGVSSGYNPYYSNIYYNGSYYNNPYYTGPYYTGPYNNYIPGWNYVPAAPPVPPPTRPGIAGNWNRPVGNVRPGQSSPATPPQQKPSTPSRPSINLPSSPSQVPDINGSNPGLVAPPQGSGLKLK